MEGTVLLAFQPGDDPQRRWGGAPYSQVPHGTLNRLCTTLKLSQMHAYIVRAGAVCNSFIWKVFDEWLMLKGKSYSSVGRAHAKEPKFILPVRHLQAGRRKKATASYCQQYWTRWSNNLALRQFWLPQTYFSCSYTWASSQHYIPLHPIFHSHLFPCSPAGLKPLTLLKRGKRNQFLNSQCLEWVLHSIVPECTPSFSHPLTGMKDSQFPSSGK